MRDFLKLSGRRLSTGWLWAFVLLALPNCALDTYGNQAGNEFFAGDAPVTNAIMCDFPKPVVEGGTSCATAQEANDGMSLASAATALAEGLSNPIALDWSPAALSACNGLPKKIEFLEGNFPDGAHVCINCSQLIPSWYDTPTEACIARCTDLVNSSGEPIPSEGAAAYCAANARTSPNFDKDVCYNDACTEGGNPKPGFFDPRRHQEPVKWIDMFGTEEVGPYYNGLKRTAATTGPGEVDFNAGAGSAQTIVKGDGWVEFEAGETGVSHVIGLRKSCDDPVNCPDTDYGLGGIGFAVSLNNDNSVYVLEAGNPLGVYGPFGLPYTKGERFRVRATDNNDGTATMSFSRLAPGCVEGTKCTEDVFYTHAGPGPSYPLRVDVTFREVDAILGNVTIVRIKK